MEYFDSCLRLKKHGNLSKIRSGTEIIRFWTFYFRNFQVKNGENLKKQPNRYTSWMLVANELRFALKKGCINKMHLSDKFQLYSLRYLLWKIFKIHRKNQILKKLILFTPDFFIYLVKWYSVFAMTLFYRIKRLKIIKKKANLTFWKR